jgi:hypothetical protein
MTSEQDVLTVLVALRQRDDEAAATARASLAYTDVTPEQATHERLRAEVAAALASDLRPSDRPVARWLLEQEIAAHVARGAGASEALYTLVAAVARFAQPTDALLLWRARQATPETRMGVDAEQLGRAGVDATRATLAVVATGSDAQAEEAQQALQWLEESAAAGAFDDLAGYFLWADERFGLTVSGPT